MSKYFLWTIYLFMYSPSYQQQSQIFQSSIYLTPFGTSFEPRNPIELLDTFSNIRSMIHCSMKCNQDRQCRTLDYDQSSRICRIFESEFSTGSVITNSSLSSSRIGAIRYDTTDTTQSFLLYNKTCDHCSNDRNRYLQCLNNRCQCPPNTYWNGQMCMNQLYKGSNCSHESTSCREDLNLTCWNETNTCVAQDSVCYQFDFQQPATLYGVCSRPQTVASADFNKDGYLDLAITCYVAHTINILFGIGNGSFQMPPMSLVSSGSNPYWLVISDFNGDGNLDFAVSNEGSNTIDIFFGQSNNGSFQPSPVTFASGGRLPSSLIAVDLNKDSKTDIVVANTASHYISIFLGLGNGTFQLLGQSYSAGSHPSSIASGDFNNDGNVDIAVTSRFSDQLFIFFGNGSGYFHNTPTVYGTRSFPYTVRTAELSGDVNLDLVIANTYNDTISIFLGTGSGTFVPATPSSYSASSPNPIGIYIQDVNADSKMDIIVSSHSGNDFIVYLGYGNGTFGENKTYLSNGYNLETIIATDFNNDGRFDLAVTNYENNTLAILLAHCTST